MFSPPSPKHPLRPVLLALTMVLPCPPRAADAPAAAPAQPGLQLSSADPVVATFNGKQIHRSDIIQDQREAGQQAMQIPLDKIYPQLLNRRLEIMLLSDAARTDKLQDDPEVKASLAKVESQVLAQAYINRVGEKAATDAALKTAYDEMVKKESGAEEIHARHILVSTEAEAKAIIAQLDKGGDFAKLADQKTKDKGPKGSNGGDLGWFRKSDMVPGIRRRGVRAEEGRIHQDPR